MPTGYTAIIEEKPDLTFREFALRCARGMGACVMQRDEPMDVLPSVQPPSDFYATRKREAEVELGELRALTDDAARGRYLAHLQEVEAHNKKSIAECAETRARYTRMRHMVMAWVPPTPDHLGLQRFMLEQIDACKSDWTPYLLSAEPDTATWLSKQIEAAEWRLANATEYEIEERRRFEERKAWIEALYASLAKEVQPSDVPVSK